MGDLLTADPMVARVPERWAHRPEEGSPTKLSPPNFRNSLRWIMVEFFATIRSPALVSIPIEPVQSGD